MFGLIKNTLLGGTEETEYKVLSSESKDGVNYEVRRYEGARYITMTSEGKTFDQATSGSMKKLLMYVGGSNDKGEGMGMSTPVTITTFPKDDGTLSDRFVVGFRIPSRYQDNPPTPTDSAMNFEQRPGMTVYALQFGGFAKESDYWTEAARLNRALGEDTPYQREHYYFCGYDPPMKPYGRRNEVWFVKEEH